MNAPFDPPLIEQYLNGSGYCSGELAAYRRLVSPVDTRHVLELTASERLPRSAVRRS